VFPAPQVSTPLHGLPSLHWAFVVQHPGIAGRWQLPKSGALSVVVQAGPFVSVPFCAGVVASTAAPSTESAEQEGEEEPVADQRGAGRPRADAVTLESVDALVEYFIAAGKKGVAINRYKGLGEMNPDQLWETTMKPEERTLLQVKAEDHAEADLMFTTLMGDQVEPRRKFIEDNALDVKNLDV